MSTTRKLNWLLLLLIILFTLVSCNPNGNDNTGDNAQAVYTAAAQTVAVQLTNNAQLQPSETTAATQILEATTAVPSIPAVNLTQPVITNTPMPTATITIAPVWDKANLIGQTPPDSTVIPTNQDFTVTWEIKNIGETTWNTNYQIRFFSGNRIGGSYSNGYSFSEEVPPNDTISISVQMQSGTETGEFTSNWVLTNDEGQNFYLIYVTVKIAAPTSTPTGEFTPTETPTETMTPTIESTTEDSGSGEDPGSTSG